MHSLLLLFPTLFLTVKHSVNIILFILFIGSIIHLYKNKLDNKFVTINYENNLFITVLISPFIAVVISQLLRGKIFINNWDSPLRMILCIPIFLAISRGWLLNKYGLISKFWVCWSIPLGILFAFISVYFMPAQHWGGYKTTYFVDPLTFCSYTLLFSMLTIIGLIYFYKTLSKFHILLNILLFLLGIYISSSSGARTGWLNFPFFLVIVIFIFSQEFDWKKSFIFSITLIAVTFMVLSNNTILILKLFKGWDELINYKLYELNSDTSVALRLSFYRMGLVYFTERPWTGWGDLSWMQVMNRYDFSQFTTEYARTSPKHGFHNEILTNSVRSGVWGLFSSLSLLITVLFISLKQLIPYKNKSHIYISACLLIMILNLFFTGLSTEITNLTFLSAFIGLSLSVFIGEKLYLDNKLNYSTS